MQYKKFEDIPIWQISRKFVANIYKLIDDNQKLKKDYSICDQLKRATYSISLNIAEGFERSSNKEFANFINIAKGSAGEVRTILYILLDNNYIENKTAENLIEEIYKISTHLSNFRSYLLDNLHYKK